MLENSDLKLLSILGRKPLATVMELSVEAKMSPRTVSKRLKTLTANKILLSVSALLLRSRARAYSGLSEVRLQKSTYS